MPTTKLGRLVQQVKPAALWEPWAAAAGSNERRHMARGCCRNSSSVSHRRAVQTDAGRGASSRGGRERPCGAASSGKHGGCSLCGLACHSYLGDSGTCDSGKRTAACQQHQQLGIRWRQLLAGRPARGGMILAPCICRHPCQLLLLARACTAAAMPPLAQSSRHCQHSLHQRSVGQCARAARHGLLHVAACASHALRAQPASQSCQFAGWLACCKSRDPLQPLSAARALDSSPHTATQQEAARRATCTLCNPSALPSGQTPGLTARR